MSARHTRIRRMTPPDLDQVVELAKSLNEAPHWPLAAYLTALDTEGTPQRIALVAEEVADLGPPHGCNAHVDLAVPAGEAEIEGLQTQLSTVAGPIAGFAIATLLPPQAELETIAVALKSQRRGVGRQLFAALAAELQRAQILEVILEARVSNRAALGLYRSLGFRESGRRVRYYSDPIEDAVLMELRIE
jgi:ribosomal protein S18 acetylase RimI-like enzyme